MNSKFTFFLFSLFLFQLTFSQVYQPIDTVDYSKRKTFLEQQKIVNDQYTKLLKTKYPGNTGKELAKNYTGFQEEFRKEIKNKDYVFNSIFSEKLREYFSVLKSKNTNIPENIKILVSKDNSPNAFCMQDGIFVINMGLFNWIDNENQLIAILGHELGHQLLMHSENLQKKLIEKDLQNKPLVSAISASKLNKTDQAFQLFKNQAYETGTFRRKHESQADSIGYVMYRKTGLPPSDYLNSLKNLQRYDTISPRLVKKELYLKLFDLPNHPFKEKWLKMEDFSLYNYGNYKEKLDKDSLSSHPEVIERIALLQKSFAELSKEESSVESTDNDFLALKKMARFEILPNFYHSEDYGVGIYTALQFLQDGEEEQYYKAWLGKNFTKIYEARKNYNLNRYLDRVDPKNQSESYQQFLNFMWNLSLDDLKYIAEFYAAN